MANLSNINNKFLVTTGGNVGIGDTGPSTKLTVDVPAVLNNTVNLFKLGDDTNGLVFKKFWDSGGIAWRLNKGISGINMMTFSQDGKVGIGTDSPTEKLHLKSTTNGCFIRFEDNGGSGVYVGARSNDLEFYAGGSEKMVILSGGNVGIGATLPIQKLEVSGNTYVTGYVQANSALIGNKVISSVNYATFGSNSTATGVALSRDWNPGTYPDLIINPSGNLGIGTTNASDINEGKLYVNGTLVLDQTSEIKYAKNNGGPYLNTRSKDNTTSACGIRIHSPYGSPGYFYGEGSGTSGSIMILDGAGQSVFQATQGNNTQIRVNNQTHLYINNSGNVGIGTTNLTGFNTILDLKKTGTNQGTNIRFKNDYNENFYIGIAGGDTTGNAIIYNANNSDIVIYTGTGGPERMRITSTGAISVGSSGTAYGTAGQVLTSNGNASPSWQAAGGGGAWTTTGNDIYNSNSGSVGIKNTSPSSLPGDSNQLVVGSGVNTGSHGSANVGITIFTANSTFPYADYARLLFTHSTSPQTGYLFEYLNRDNSGYSDSEPSLTIKHSGDNFIGITNQTNNTTLPKIVLDTNYFNSSLTQGSLHRAMFTIPVRSGVNNPGMHIYGDSQGNSNPFVGFTSTSSSSSITTKFIRFYHNSTLCGTIQKRFNANEVQYLTTSDYRLKEDLKPFKALDTICKIKVYNYKWNNIEVDNVNYGVLAHELQELIPEVVAGEKDEVNKNGEEEYQSVDYSKLVPHLIQSIQELKADNNSLKARIETLENK